MTVLTIEYLIIITQNMYHLQKTSSLKEESEEVSSLVSQVHSLGDQVKMLETSKEQVHFIYPSTFVAVVEY